VSRDLVLEGFLARQREAGSALAQESDLLDLVPLDGPPTQRYRAKFSCRGLIRSPDGEIREADHFEVGIWFPADYLRRVEPLEVLTWLGPRQIHHPNISDRVPLICVGRFGPGTALVDLLYMCFEVITYQKVTMREDDALNHDACVWARQHQHLFPVDRRPLKRRVRGHASRATGVEVS
jgi:hypothetical protein